MADRAVKPDSQETGASTSGGGRAGRELGGSLGSPRWPRILRMTSPASIVAITDMRPPQREGHQALEGTAFASNAREPSAEHAAGQELSELALDEPRQTAPIGARGDLGAKGLEVLAHHPMEDGALHGPGLVAGAAHTRRPQPGACRPGSAGKRPISRGWAATDGNASAQQPVARTSSRRRCSPAGCAAPGPATPPTPPAGAPARRARRSPADGPSVSCRAAPAATRAAPAATHPGRRTASTRPA